MTIGEKIKQLREEKELTQKELCGDHMTRNMLSQIEHNSAQPSVATIMYIASKLDIDAGYFLSETDDPSVFKKLKIIDSVRMLHKQGEYEKCLELAENDLLTDTELAIYFYSSALQLAEKAYRRGDFTTALELYEKSSFFATLFPADLPFEEISSHYTELCKKIVAGKPSDYSFPDGGGFIASLYESTHYEFLLKLIKNGKSELAAQIFDQLKLSNPLFRKHINARLSMAASNHSRARTLLSEIVEQLTDLPPDVSFRYIVYSDLEKSCKALGDYEGAYTSTVAKTEIAKNYNIKAFEEV